MALCTAALLLLILVLAGAGCAGSTPPPTGSAQTQVTRSTSPSSIGSTQSATTTTEAKQWGDVLVPAADWSGVDVFNNYPRPDPYDAEGSSGYGVRWQCAELAQRLYAVKYGFPKTWGLGSAYLIFDHTLTSTDKVYELKSYDNGTQDSQLQKYDLVVWDSETPDTGANGHVAIVETVSGETVTVLEQNYAKMGRATLVYKTGTLDDSRTPGHIQGWVRAVKVPEATSTAAPLSSSEKDLGNGLVRAGGFITRAWVDGGIPKLKIDYADFLTGREAEDAAAAVGQTVDNDYFIRNQSGKVRTFSVSPTAVIEIPTNYPTAPAKVNWAQFVDAYYNGYNNSNSLPEVYWWIERRGDKIVSIKGQWTP